MLRLAVYGVNYRVRTGPQPRPRPARRAGALPRRRHRMAGNSGVGPANALTPSSARNFVTDVVEMPDGGAPPVTEATLTAGGSCSSVRRRQFALRISGGVPAQQGADGGGVVRRDHHEAALRGRAHQGGGIEPAPDGVLPALRFSRRSSESPSSSSAAAYPPAATGSAPTVATIRAFVCRNGGFDVVPGGGDHGLARERPQLSAVRNPPWHRAGRPAVAVMQPPGRRGRRTPPALRHGGFPLAPAMANGPCRTAARRFAAGFADQRRRVAGPRHLDQDRAAFQSFLGGAPRSAGRRAILASGSRSSSKLSAVFSTRGTVRRTRRGPPPPAMAQPASTRRCSSVLRVCPASRQAAPSCPARSRRTSREWAYGERCSMCRSSPSSQQTTRPRFWTGA